MMNLSKRYQTAKNKANTFMKNGQISKYFEALLEMNEHKKIMTPIRVK